MNKMQQDLRLLPNKVKPLAYGLLILSVLLAVLAVLKVVSFEAEVLKAIVKSGILIGLLLLALAKNKIEDELTLHIRVKAFAFAFIFGVVSVIAKPFVNLAFDGEFLYEDMGAMELLISMFVVYFLMMNLMKKNR